MYLRAKYTKYKMAKTKFSIWRYIICEICKKNGSNRPFLASRVADTIFPPPIEGHHRQLDNQCKDPMDKTKDCRVGQLTRAEPPCIWPWLPWLDVSVKSVPCSSLHGKQVARIPLLNWHCSSGSCAWAKCLCVQISKNSAPNENKKYKQFNCL